MFANGVYGNLNVLELFISFQRWWVFFIWFEMQKGMKLGSLGKFVAVKFLSRVRSTVAAAFIIQTVKYRSDVQHEMLQ